MTSIHLYNTGCPECNRRGRDKHGDNLAVYDDGHCYCWSCGYWQPSDVASRVGRLAVQSSNKINVLERPPVILPSDCDTYIPAVARSWLGKYVLTEPEIVANKLLWSEYYQQLIFPYFDKYGTLLAYQARNFTEDRPKWWSQGDLKEVFHILPFQEEYDTIVLVEDIISAIKVSRIVSAMPLFGNNVSNRLKRLYRLTKHISIWLDPDMRKKTLLEANKARQLGFDVDVVFSDKDPKEYSTEEIKGILNDKR